MNREEIERLDQPGEVSKRASMVVVLVIFACIALTLGCNYLGFLTGF